MNMGENVHSLYKIFINSYNLLYCQLTCIFIDIYIKLLYLGILGEVATVLKTLHFIKRRVSVSSQQARIQDFVEGVNFYMTSKF